jgi:hypothetical protein
MARDGRRIEMRRTLCTGMRHLERGPALRCRRITKGCGTAQHKVPTADSTGCDRSHMAPGVLLEHLMPRSYNPTYYISAKRRRAFIECLRLCASGG